MADERAAEMADWQAAQRSATTTSPDYMMSRVLRITSVPAIESIVRSLRAQLGEGFDPAVIIATVEAEFARYSEARVTQFIPIIVERRLRARLRTHHYSFDPRASRPRAATTENT